MKEKIFLGVIVVSFVMLAETAFATPNWDITGTWTWNYYYGSGTYTHTMIIDTFDTTSGDFSGNGYYNPNPDYTWDITGTVDGDDIDFYIDYTGLNPTYYVDATGIITSSTYMSGTATAPGQAARWDATGEATNIQDSDGDGVPVDEDCDDNNAEVKFGPETRACVHYNNCNPGILKQIARGRVAPGLLKVAPPDYAAGEDHC